MLAHTRSTVWRAERAVAEAGVIAALRQLRRLGLAEFADVLRGLPDRELVELSRVLPGWPAEEVQLASSGSAGRALMHDGVSFLRVVAGAFRDLAGRRLQDQRILDFGCGWGVLPRLLLFASDPDGLSGVDPSAEALDLCRAHGVLGRLARHEPLAPRLPFAQARFDLIVSQTSFARSSLAQMDAAMDALRLSVAEDGMLALAVRPVEFWDFLAQQGAADSAEMRARHLQDGFAFRPDATGAGATDGDVSIDIGWFAARYPRWELRGTDRGWDELRTILLLTPR